MRDQILLGQMRHFFKRLFGSKDEPTEYRSVSFDLVDRPFTEALLTNFKRQYAEAATELKETAQYISPPYNPATLSEAASSAAVSLAHQLTVETVAKLGGSAVYIPGHPVPKNAPIVVAFGIFVLAGLQHELNGESVVIDFHEAALNTAGLFYVLHPETEKVLYIREGINAFRVVAQSDNENVKGWHDNLMNLVRLYILQLTSIKPEAKDFDTMGLLGQLLNDLLRTVE